MSKQTGAASDLRTDTTTILPMAMIIAVLINLIPFHQLMFHARKTGYPAIYESMHVGTRGGEIIRNKWGLFTYLGNTYPGLDIILPTGSNVDLAPLYALARIQSVRYEDYDPKTEPADVKPVRFLTADRHAARSAGANPTAIALGDADPKEMILLVIKDIVSLVDVTLVQ
jgi:hypothetical protein